MPFGASVMSPFGYGIFNPVTIGYVYLPTYYWSGAGGARTGTTSGVPLTSAPWNALVGRRSGSNAPQLPRLGTTATLRPTINAPLRGAEVAAPRMSFGREGLAGQRNAPIFNNNINNNVGMPSSPVMSAPRSAPAPAPAPSPAPSAGARVGAMRR